MRGLSVGEGEVSFDTNEPTSRVGLALSNLSIMVDPI